VFVLVKAGEFKVVEDGTERQEGHPACETSFRFNDSQDPKYNNGDGGSSSSSSSSSSTIMTANN